MHLYIKFEPKKLAATPFFVTQFFFYYVLIFNEKDIFHYKSATSGTNVICFFSLLKGRK